MARWRVARHLRLRHVADEFGDVDRRDAAFTAAAVRSRRARVRACKTRYPSSIVSPPATRSRSCPSRQEGPLHDDDVDAPLPPPCVSAAWPCSPRRAPSPPCLTRAMLFRPRQPARASARTILWRRLVDCASLHLVQTWGAESLERSSSNHAAELARRLPCPCPFLSRHAVRSHREPDHRERFDGHPLRHGASLPVTRTPRAGARCARSLCRLAERARVHRRTRSSRSSVTSGATACKAAWSWSARSTTTWL